MTVSRGKQPPIAVHRDVSSSAHLCLLEMKESLPEGFPSERRIQGWFRRRRTL